MFEQAAIQKFSQRLLEWGMENVLATDVAVQIVLIGIALLVGVLARKKLLPRAQPAIDKLTIHYRSKLILSNLCRLVMQIVALIVILIGTRIAAADFAGGTDMGLARAVMALLGAWIAIRLIVQFIENNAVRNLFSTTVWVIAALHILGVFDETIAVMDSIGMNFGTARLSVLTVTKGLFALSVLLYAALFLSGVLERRVQKETSLTMSSRVLIGKIIRIALVTFALLIGVTAAGIDMSLFAVFSGALGLGVGFGLQKGISNLFSGMLLLMDKSIKPGDILELQNGAFGWVQHMGARYTEVITRDNKSFLIPNEDFITQQVVNWSHGDTLIRLEVKFGVHCESNPHIVKKLSESAAVRPSRVVASPAPICHLIEFGESSLNFVLRFWIKDAEKGVTNMRGEVMLALWDTFQENGIRIPYPHREVYVHQDTEIRAS